MANRSGVLQKLRALMVDRSIVKEPLAAYIVPSGDAHCSEYICDTDKRRAYVSGFDGSLGTAIITENQALMWTDGRYFLQAAQQMNSDWTLMKQGVPGTPTQSEWLSKNLTNGATVGVDPMLYSCEEWQKMEKELKTSGKLLRAVEKNLVDLVWTDQPVRPVNPAKLLSLEYAGKSTAEKLKDVRDQMREEGAEYMIVSELDQIAWLLNLRGSDIPYNPVFFAYVIVTPIGFEFFIDPAKLSDGTRENLKTVGGNVTFLPYDSIIPSLQEHLKNAVGKIWLSKSCNYAIGNLVPEAQQIVKLTPISLMKALKNETEIQGMINCHVRDAVALCNFFAWLEAAMLAGEKLTEVSVADKLESFRAAQKHFVGLSFATISGSGPNGAIIHYDPNSAPESRQLSINEMYLVDSGGQYLDGTTDVTRTLHFGQPSDYQRECFTRVLKGVIALVNAVFPNKVVGNTLDTLARKALWDVGHDYAHGTGHGIGAYLNVHEGPHGISWRHLPDDPGLQESMFVSNEPGYYEEGQFGIRIENIIRIVQAHTKYNFSNRGYLTFEDVTFVPIQRKLIKQDILTSDEITYMNNYHEKCRKIVGKCMENIPEYAAGLQWLMKETEPIGK